jgi:xylulokinase
LCKYPFNLSLVSIQACAPGLAERLAEPVITSQKLGPVSGYLRERYDFADDCSVVAFTGDNPVTDSLIF